MRRERFGEHVTHFIGPSPVMFDDLVGDPGHPSILNAPPSPAGRSRRVFPNITRSAASDLPPGFVQIRTQHGRLICVLVMRRGGQRTEARRPPWDMPLIKPPSNSLPTLCRPISL